MNNRGAKRSRGGTSGAAGLGGGRPQGQYHHTRHLPPRADTENALAGNLQKMPQELRDYLREETVRLL